MKKLLLLILTATLFTMCKSTGSSTAAKADTLKDVAEVRYRDDFKEASVKERSALLQKLKATGKNYSVLVLTQNYKGEKVTVTTGAKKAYSGYAISNLKTGIAETIRLDNTADTKVYDNLTKKEVLIEATAAQKHKFIYLMKNPGGTTPFILTYSNKLRPLE